MTDKNGRWVKIDFDQEECDAAAALAEIAVQQILANEQFVKRADQERLRAVMNRVKMKFSQAAIVLGGANIIQLPTKIDWNKPHG